MGMLLFRRLCQISSMPLSMCWMLLTLPAWDVPIEQNMVKCYIFSIQSNLHKNSIENVSVILQGCELIGTRAKSFILGGVHI